MILLKKYEEMIDILTIKQLSKQFNSQLALQEVSMQVADGQILGLIGQNGAGKSTTFHSILNFIDYKGTISWNHAPITKHTLNQIGFLPEERSLFTELTVQQQVTYFAQLKGRSKKWIQAQLPMWLAKFAVKGNPTDKISSLSKGNQQKIQLICTLIHEPQLIILDEPFSGLDPVNADFLKQAILDAKKHGATIIFSSHNMNNIAELCDEIVMLNNGKVVLNGPIEEIRNQFGKNILFVTTDMAVSELAQLPGVDRLQVRGPRQYKLHLTHPEVGRDLFQQISHGEYIEEFSQQAPSLDEIFRNKVGQSHA
jgi:ABC-2 type transport system ATP-binding protein